MRRLAFLALLLLALAVGLVFAGRVGLGPLVITREGDQQLILFLGSPQRVTEPGPALRWPFVETAESYSRRWLNLNAKPDTILTADGEQLIVDSYAIWRIRDPKEFKRTFPSGIEAAETGIDRSVRDDVREVLGRHTLEQVLDSQRAEIMREITARTQAKVGGFGIEVADVRINRTELPTGAEESVYARMKTERERLGRKNRAEGDERARRIRAEADREATVIVANARRDAEIARGEGEALAARIYAEAYGGDAEFYAFVRSLEAYRIAVDEDTTLVLSPHAEFFRFLESSTPPPRPGR
ncbi:MAG TPA: protease modulator HflC [Myxococcota bacterium]|nr:protease modulator HflC [Myxococcota bacterium]